MFVRMILLALVSALPLRDFGYTVRPGDTLSGIAARNHVSVSALAAANRLQNSNFIRIGMVLDIPSRGGSGSYTYYRVRWGDTLSGIAVRYGISVAAIRAINPRLGFYPLAGELLRVCNGCGGSTATSSPSRAVSGPSSSGLYVVRPGDTLSGIAANHGVTVASLLASNRLLNADLIVIGMRIAIPVEMGSTAEVSGVQSLLAADARYDGIDPALVLAVGWQESGWNEGLISSTGAVGVMQVEPYTNAEIANLTGRRFDLYATADNVAAGTYWLGYLLRYYGGNAGLAVAAYYQGSRSISRHGLFSDTVQYVNNVNALRLRFGG